MLINNLIFNQNKDTNYNNLNKNSKKNSVNFTGRADILSREIKLDNIELEKISLISEAYHKILEIFNSFNGIYQKKFKSLYPGIVSSEKIKGLVFTNISKLNNKHLQIVRFNTKAGSDEILTFGILDSQNKNLIRYRVDNSGKVLISADKKNINELSVNPFDTTKNIKYNDYLNQFSNEIHKFCFYSENFKAINRQAHKTKDVKINKVISNILEIKQSLGIKDDIDKIIQNYKNLTEVLNLKQGKDALKLKQEYFGNVSAKTKGLVFTNLVGTENKTIAFCPLTSKDDDRLFKIVIYNSDNKLENTFVFFADGKAAKQKKLSEATNDFRLNNLIQISDNEINQLGIKNIFESLNKQFADFKNFIIEKRNTKVTKKQKNNIQNQKVKLKQQKNKKAAESARIKEEKMAMKKAEIEARKNFKLQLKEQKQQEKLALKLQKQEEAKKLAELKNSQQNEKLPANQKVDNIQQIKFTNYRDLKLWKVTQALNDLFNLPVEQRSPHLIHEQLSNGKIFAGRFTVKAPDGANIIVSRVKSPKYVDFTYYSIKVKKDGKEFTLNIDPEASKILFSKDGKPVINKNNMVSYISKDNYLSANPDAKNLPVYLNEILENRGYEKRQFIKYDAKQKTQTLLKQKENEIMEALQNYIVIPD